MRWIVHLFFFSLLEYKKKLNSIPFVNSKTLIRTIKSKMEKKFELAVKNAKIPHSHKCSKCDFLLFEAFECEDRCGVFCKEHLPENGECRECGNKFSFNQKLSEKINQKYEIICLRCEKKMLLKEYSKHLKENCDINCPQKCEKSFKTDQEIEKHLKEECINTIISCLGCELTDKREIIKEHEEICEKAKKHLKMMEPFEKKLFLIFTQLSSFKENIYLLQKENYELKKENEKQNKRCNTIEQQNEIKKRKIKNLKQKLEIQKEKINEFEKYSPLLENLSRKLEIEFYKDSRSIKGMFGSFCSLVEMKILKTFLIEEEIIESENENSREANNKKTQFCLVYKASVNGFGASDFHQNCDGKEEILVLIKANNYIFGFFYFFFYFFFIFINNFIFLFLFFLNFINNFIFLFQFLFF